MGKTLGEMTPDERNAAISRAAALFQDELDRTAGAIGQVLDGDAPALSLQFCDTSQNLDMTGWPSRELDADEVRLWAPDGTLIASVARVAGKDDLWEVTGSDEATWQDIDYYPTWRTAMQALVGNRTDHEIPED